MNDRNPPYKIKTDGQNYWLVDKDGARCSRITDRKRYIEVVKKSYESNDENDEYYKNRSQNTDAK